MTRNGLVALVEDNPDDAELILRAFAKNHLAKEIVVLRDGQEAVDWFFAESVAAGRRPAVPPEVVLLDLKLPRLDGFEVLRRLRAHEGTKRVPVVVFTSSREKADIAKSYDLYANGFVQKPLALSDLVATVQRLGSYWLMANEPPPAE